MERTVGHTLDKRKVKKHRQDSLDQSRANSSIVKA